MKRDQLKREYKTDLFFADVSRSGHVYAPPMKQHMSKDAYIRLKRETYKRGLHICKQNCLSRTWLVLRAAHVQRCLYTCKQKRHVKEAYIYEKRPVFCGRGSSSAGVRATDAATHAAAG